MRHIVRLNMKKNKIVIFDFDHTIYDGDSMYDFFYFLNRKKFYALFFIYILKEVFVYKSLLKPSKNRFIQTMTKGRSSSELTLLSQMFYSRYQDRLKVDAYLKIEEYRLNFFDIIISTASLDIWVKPFADALEAKLLSTLYEDTKDGINIIVNNKGKNKVNLIRKSFNLENYDDIHSFGDSKADLYLKEISTEFFYKKI